MDSVRAVVDAKGMPAHLGLTPGAARGYRLCSARIATRQEKLAASDLAFTKLDQSVSGCAPRRPRPSPAWRPRT